MSKQIVKSASKHGWVSLKNLKDPYMTSYKKDLDGGTARINIWKNDRNDYLTVGTYINHPKLGRNQLFRKYCTPQEVESIFQNPRIHTGKGYR
jgi:hypothetical protein